MGTNQCLNSQRSSSGLSAPTSIGVEAANCARAWHSLEEPEVIGRGPGLQQQCHRADQRYPVRQTPGLSEGPYEPHEALGYFQVRQPQSQQP